MHQSEAVGPLCLFQFHEDLRLRISPSMNYSLPEFPTPHAFFADRIEMTGQSARLEGTVGLASGT